MSSQAKLQRTKKQSPTSARSHSEGVLQTRKSAVEFHRGAANLKAGMRAVTLVQDVQDDFAGKCKRVHWCKHAAEKIARSCLALWPATTACRAWKTPKALSVQATLDKKASAALAGPTSMYQRKHAAPELAREAASNMEADMRAETLAQRDMLVRRRSCWRQCAGEKMAKSCSANWLAATAC